MAKIDTSKIEGYADMTAEQKLAALESYETPDPDYSGYVKKELYDKTASELAQKKKELIAKMTDDEQAKAKAAEAQVDLQKKYEELLHKSTVSEYKAKYLAMGYDEKLAADTAEAMASGDTEKVFANQQTYLGEYAKTIKAETLKATPRPNGEGGAGNMDYNKKIDEARTAGDMTAMAYYTRLQAQAEADAANANKS